MSTAAVAISVEEAFQAFARACKAARSARERMAKAAYEYVDAVLAESPGKAQRRAAMKRVAGGVRSLMPGACPTVLKNAANDLVRSHAVRLLLGPHMGEHAPRGKGIYALGPLVLRETGEGGRDVWRIRDGIEEGVIALAGRIGQGLASKHFIVAEAKRLRREAGGGTGLPKRRPAAPKRNPPPWGDHPILGLTAATAKDAAESVLVLLRQHPDPETFARQLLVGMAAAGSVLSKPLVTAIRSAAAQVDGRVRLPT